MEVEIVRVSGQALGLIENMQAFAWVALWLAATGLFVACFLGAALVVSVGLRR